MALNIDHSQNKIVNDSGNAQSGIAIYKITTTTGVTVDIAGISIPTDTTVAFSILVVARRTDADNESAGYKIEGVIDNNAGTVAFVGSPTTTVLGEDNAAWDATATANDTDDRLDISVMGQGTKTVDWVVTVYTSEVTG